MSRKNDIKNQQLDFITSGIPEQYSLLKFGFELEYQNNMDSSECECDFNAMREELDFYDSYDTEAICDAENEQTAEQIDDKSEIQWFLERHLRVTRKNKAFKKLVREKFVACKTEYLMLLSEGKELPWEYRHDYKHHWEARKTIYGVAYSKAEKEFLKKYLIPGVMSRIETLLDCGALDCRSDYFDSDYNNTNLDRDELYDYVRESVSEHIEYYDYMHSIDYLRGEGILECECGMSDCERDRDSLVNGADLCESGTDQSVNGGEIRTTGGHHIDDCLDGLDTVLKNFDSQLNGIEVDSHCSFHIHTKLGDIHHKFGPVIHGLIYEFILWNMDLLPEGVVSRLESPNRHISANIAKAEKFNLINFHSQGTIEFRFFGNIDSVENAALCFDFVRQCLEYVYTKKLSLDRSTLDHWYIEQELRDIEKPSTYRKFSRPISMKKYVLEKLKELVSPSKRIVGV